MLTTFQITSNPSTAPLLEQATLRSTFILYINMTSHGAWACGQHPTGADTALSTLKDNNPSLSFPREKWDPSPSPRWDGQVLEVLYDAL